MRLSFQYVDGALLDWRVGGKSAKGLAPHGLRHAAKTRMEGFRTPPKLMDEHMGHIDGSVQARYSHITRQMRDGLMVHFTAD